MLYKTGVRKADLDEPCYVREVGSVIPIGLILVLTFLEIE